MKAMFSFLVLLAILGLSGCDQMTRQPEPLIPRAILFGNPQRARLRLSPDGSEISFLAPVDGVMNVWIAPRGHPEQARPITHDHGSGIHSEYFWAYTNDQIIYTQDQGGNENWNVHAVNIATGQDRNLTPNPKVAARIEGVSETFPEVIVVGLNDRDPAHHDLHKINIRTGADELLAQNPGQIQGQEVDDLIVDDDYRLRFAITMVSDGGQEIFKHVDATAVGAAPGPAATAPAQWQSFAKISMEDALTTSIEGLDHSGQTLYWADSRNRDTAALFSMDMKTGQTKLLAEDPRADVGGLMAQPASGMVQAVSFDYERQHWVVLDPAIKGDMDYLKTVADGDFEVTSRTLDDKLWTVAYIMDNGPVRFYIYDREHKKADYIFSDRDDMGNLPLATMHPVVIKSRDGLNMVCYYTLPVSAAPGGATRPDHPVPMVLDVHGGPWARDDWGFDPEHQWLANRGYAVLSVNYRGSTGFGKAFINAGNRQWASTMQDDLVDAVHWAVDQKIADPQKVAIMGGSYGGYATLVGLTFTPDEFACGVDVCGPTRLLTLMQTIPPYWAPAIAQFRVRVGDDTTAAGRAFLDSRSPLTFVDRIKKPLLIGQGANDPRVKEAEADQIVKAMQAKQIPVTYVIYSDEGHGFARPENNLSFNAVTEAFLAEHLGGRFQPVGNDFEDSTIRVPVGADQVQGLQQALSGMRPPASGPAETRP